ncbi:GTP-binding protein LepA [Desulfurella multipotens]|uniref:Elongation factor 4 n=2 Tax=Desulfurella multipotens TaxID=79269 RepID=A0A1G6PDG4_9BACT|nr:translation elongation factor 4 [Desulfurella multipotens]SDC78041.1 GTP-binding protein LepA [Desulfurella multipotens]
MIDIKNIRNFSIIAHIDHGKSTLADRLIEKTGSLDKRQMKDQVLDNLEVERRHGITVKAQAVRMEYLYDGVLYELNMIDTPGHADFTYEVSKSLSACEGALLVVDATQGVEAQTVANLYLALENNLEIIPVINKIDLPTADIEKTKSEIENLGLDASGAILISAKNDIGTDKVLEAIIKYIPPPKINNEETLKALIIDSWYDNYKGVVCLVRVFEGEIKIHDRIMIFSNKKEYNVESISVLTPKPKEIETLHAGEVGILISNIKNIDDVLVGDTITLASNPAKAALKGFKKIKPFVYAGIYPTDTEKYDDLKEGLEKLKLNDSSLEFEPEKSDSLGFGFRCGFLGMLHMNITKERLEEEFGLDIVVTNPSVLYKVEKTDGSIIEISNPKDLPEPQFIRSILEPYVSIDVITPSEYIGSVLNLLQEKRGYQKNLSYLSANRCLITYSAPLSETITNFYDTLKSITRGYASFNYEFEGYKPSDLVKMIILINNEPIDSFSQIVHKDKAYAQAREVLAKLKEFVPRQLFEIRLQAKVGGKIIAKEEIKALRKDVLAKCYGGDITRKRKLLEKQKEGKKKLKQLGKVAISKEAFMKLLEPTKR